MFFLKIQNLILPRICQLLVGAVRRLCIKCPETGEIFNTFSMVTTEANPLMAHIHNVKKRMPLILDKNSMLDWIKPDLEKDQITSLMKPLDENNMQAHTISKLITSRTDRTDVPEVKKEFVYSELNELF